MPSPQGKKLSGSPEHADPAFCGSLAQLLPLWQAERVTHHMLDLYASVYEELLAVSS